MIPMEHTIGSSPSRSRITECWSGGKGGGSHPQYPGVEPHVKESNKSYIYSPFGRGPFQLLCWKPGGPWWLGGGPGGPWGGPPMWGGPGMRGPPGGPPGMPGGGIRPLICGGPIIIGGLGGPWFGCGGPCCLFCCWGGGSGLVLDWASNWRQENSQRCMRLNQNFCSYFMNISKTFKLTQKWSIYHEHCPLSPKSYLGPILNIIFRSRLPIFRFQIL